MINSDSVCNPIQCKIMKHSFQQGMILGKPFYDTSFVASMIKYTKSQNDCTCGIYRFQNVALHILKASLFVMMKS